MNRDELLQTVLGIAPDDYKPGAKMIEATEGGQLVAHADIYWRRVVVMPPTVAAGEVVAMAATTLTVARIANVCVDPAVKGTGWGRALIQSCHEEAASHERVDFCAVLTDEPSFFEYFGYVHPAGARDPRFFICPLRWREVKWPEGRVEVAW